MKHLMMTVVTVLTLGVTMTMVKADTYQSGRDADIMRERGQVWNYSEAKREPQLANYNTDGRYLSEATNLNCTILSESIRHLMKSDAFGTLRKMNPLSMIRIATLWMMGTRSIILIPLLYQPESTDFGKLSYIGHFQLEDGTIYRYWK